MCKIFCIPYVEKYCLIHTPAVSPCMSSWIQAISFLVGVVKICRCSSSWKVESKHIMRDTQHFQVTCMWNSFIPSNVFYLEKKNLSNSHLTRNKIIGMKKYIRTYFEKIIINWQYISRQLREGKTANSATQLINHLFTIWISGESWHWLHM